jgi:F-type H+-transporting ATPase subunit epsilon
MAARSFSVDIVTPDRMVLSDQAVSLVATGVEGSFGILVNHAPMLAELAPGELHYRREASNETVRLAVGGGFLQVTDNKVSVLADTAERASEIDVDRARRAREAARARLSQVQGFDDDARAQVETELARATARLRVAEG